MSIDTEVLAANIIVEQTTGDIDLIVDQPVVIVDVPAASPVIVEVAGTPGAPGKPGAPGPPGPTAVSTDAGNTARLGSDSLIYVPLSFDQATADARYVNAAGDTIPGLLYIDRGPGAGVPLLRLRTNAGEQVISSDGSSYTTFSNGIVVPTLYTGGLGFTGAAQIDMNGGNITHVGRMDFSSATSHISMYNDYNGFPSPDLSGYVHRYASRNVNEYASAFQAYKDGDPTEKPFFISSHGYGWLRNALGNKPVLTLRGAPDQNIEILRVENAAGTPAFRANKDGTCYATILRVPGTDLWNDGRIYFANQATHVAGTAEELYTNKPMLLGADPTKPMHAATKQYADARWTRWSGTQAQYDAIPVKDANTLYVIV